MEQFTASEVRDLAKRGTDAMQQFIDGRHTLHVPPQFDDADMVIAECLRAVDAFADMLEAQEKAEAIGFLSGGALAALVDCRSDDYNGNVDLWMRSNDAVKATIPVYTRPSPSDAERLAEAVRNLVSEWVAIADDGDTTLEDSTIGYRACANRLSAMLATHSAQAQPHTVHPEHSCEECGGQNVTWFAPSELWNDVVRGPNGRDLMLCPMCFIKRAEKIGQSNDAWSVRPEFYEESAQPPAARVPDIDTMVTRFLGWRLPQDFAPDAGISFKPMPDEYMPHCWPTGTNLFHAGQAKEMILHMLAAQENPNG